MKRTDNPIMAADDKESGVRCLNRPAGREARIGQKNDKGKEFIPCVRRMGHAPPHYGAQTDGENTFWWEW